MRENTVWRRICRRLLAMALAASMVAGGIGGSAITSYAGEIYGTEEDAVVPEDAVLEDAVTEDVIADDADAEDAVTEEVIADDADAEDDADAVAEDVILEDAVTEEVIADDANAEDDADAVAEDVILEDAVTEDMIADDADAEDDADAVTEDVILEDAAAKDAEDADSVIIEAEDEVIIEADEEVITEEAQHGDDLYPGNSFKPYSVNNSVMCMGVKNISAGQHIYFGTKHTSYRGKDDRPTWRVLAKRTNDGRDGLFLLSENLIGNKVWPVKKTGNITFNDENLNNSFQGSAAQTWCKTFLDNTFSDKEKKAIYETTKTDKTYVVNNTVDITRKEGSITFGASSLNKDKVFFLSAEEANNPAYGFSDTDRNLLLADLLSEGVSLAHSWWLRSPDTYILSSVRGVGYVGGGSSNGANIYATFPSGNDPAARPAFNLNPNTVVFSSAAKGGKFTGVENGESLYAIGKTNFASWELTLLDDGSANAVGSGHKGFEVNDFYFIGATCNFKYKGATTGDKEYISAVVTDSNGNIKQYGNLLKVKNVSGSASIDLSGKISATDRLYIFQEQLNGDYMTDYCSALCEIDLSIKDIVTVSLPTLPYNNIWDPNHAYGKVNGSNYEIERQGWLEDDGTLGTSVEAFKGGKFYWYYASIRPKHNRPFKLTTEGLFAGEVNITHPSDGFSESSYNVKGVGIHSFNSHDNLDFIDPEKGVYTVVYVDSLLVLKKIYLKPIKVTGVVISTSTGNITTGISLTVGQKETLTANVYPSTADDKTVTWTSSNTKVATVDSNGNVSAVAAGTAKITATAKDGTGVSRSCTVAVKAPVKTPDDLTKDFITRAYREILGRTPDTSGMNYWFGELKAKRLGGGMMVAQFLNSREFVNKKYNSGKTMDIMYRVYMNRTPEESGKKFWMDYLDNGLSVIYVAKGFTASAEFQNICKSYGIDPGTVALTQNRDKNEKVTRFVSRCYKESLGRNGEESGLNYWTGELLARRITPAKVAEQFVFSKEMNSKGYDNSRFIQMLYRLCMGRTYDQAGLNYWLGEMNKGMTRQQVFTSFVNSREFQNIVKSYGL